MPVYFCQRHALIKACDAIVASELNDVNGKSKRKIRNKESVPGPRYEWRTYNLPSKCFLMGTLATVSISFHCAPIADGADK